MEHIYSIIVVILLLAYVYSIVIIKGYVESKNRTEDRVSFMVSPLPESRNDTVFNIVLRFVYWECCLKDKSSQQATV